MASSEPAASSGVALDMAGCYCLGEDPRHSMANLFIGMDDLVLKSETDEQLCLCLALQQTCKLSEIEFGFPNDDSCPDTVMIFVNKLNMGFSDCEDFPPTLKIHLEPNGQRVFPLSATKFSRVDTLTIFVQDNHGDEVSCLSSVRLSGTNMDGINVSNIKKCWYVLCGYNLKEMCCPFH